MCVKINGDAPKRALLKEARGPTRRAALLKIITKGRPFHVTRKGAFIVPIRTQIQVVCSSYKN